ncbi:MAG: glucoamylase family protein, partial [Bacillota bacterium]
MKIFGLYAVIIVVIVFLLVLLRRYYLNRENEEQEITDVILNAEELERHAVDIAKKHVIAKSSRASFSLEDRMNRNFKLITSVYLSLNDYVKESKRVTPASEWLLDNFYIIEEQVKEIRQNLSKKYYMQLPRLKSGILRGYPRVYAIALEMVSHTDGRFDDKALISFISAYQTQSLLSSGELWAIPLMVRMALIEHIKYICDKIMLSQQQWCKAEKLAFDLLQKRGGSPEELLSIAKESMRGMEKITPSFGEHLLNMLKKHGLEIAPIIRYIDDRLSEQHTNGENITQLEHNEQAIRQVSIGNSITSLRFISTLDWTEVFESLSKVEKILRQDPDGTYLQMDFLSRDFYRHEVEKLAKKSRISEIQIAKKAIECAASNNRHVGYYLFGKEKSELREKIGRNESRLASTFFWYIFSIIAISIAIIYPFSAYAYNIYNYDISIVLLAAAVLLLPASDIAVCLVNWAVTRIKSPDFLPKLELKEGIPDNARTIVIIPTLLPNEKRVRQLLEQLEEYYLANKEKNLYFALVGDFKDHSEKTMDGDESIVKTAVQGINYLNSKYAGDEDIFFFFHRERVYSKAQNRWMGWERKRGAIVEFNDLLKGESNTSYKVIVGNMKHLEDIKYVLTIDADTRLSIETAKKLIGTLMHPLNKAVIDESLGIVTEGYGLLQPRISVDIVSSNATAFSRIFAGQGGIDIYTNAVSDVYQDLFGEGIFTGKGIYELDVFHRLLKDAVPDNAVLSHDLLEGSYVRTGLVTDIELIDGYPAKYSSYAMRLHRWVRGDWQLLRWLMPRVRNRKGELKANPLSALTKWKILDNMRRSLSAPGSMLLIALGLTVLPGNALVWLFMPLLANALQLFTCFLDIIVSRFRQPYIEKASFTMAERLRRLVLQILVNISFLPHQALLMLNAISKSLIRVFITKRNLLEWVTAADMETGLRNDLISYMKRMWVCPFAGTIAIVLSMYFRQEAIYVTAFLSVLWLLAPLTAYKISNPESKKDKILTEAELAELRRISRKTWSFFEEFVGALDNYLPPDNYQENPPNGIAHRTSPTNIGLLLISTMAARDFGYISTAEMLERLNKSITTIEKMRKWKGHLYNWYDTITLEVLRPRYISTVDSGNFIGYLITLKQGLLEYKNRRLVDLNLALGLRDTLQLAVSERQDSGFASDVLDELVSKNNISLTDWKAALEKLDDMNRQKRPKWGYKLHKMTSSYMKEVNEYFPWYFSLKEVLSRNSMMDEADSNEIGMILDMVDSGMAFSQLPEQIEKLILLIENIIRSGSRVEKINRSTNDELANIVSLLKKSHELLNANLLLADDIIERVKCIIDDTKFLPLFDNKRKLFSIGYNEEEEQLTKSYYDLLASEARQSSFIAIASGEVKKEHWFMLDRTLTSSDGLKGLVSWTGTMFEYLMPLILMRNYENTLLSETYYFVLKSQMEYGRKRHVAWGVSESGYYSFDFKLNYQYKAFGIPSLGLKRGLINDTVIAPYATMLALMVDSRASLLNLIKLRNEGMESSYGFYEAIDYTPERMPRGKKSSIVKSYMAHHQGMGFLAINNIINDNILQRRFHSEPIIKAAEILLQEKIPSKVIFTKDYKEKIEPFKEAEREDIEYSKVFGLPAKNIPECHILSNGSYSVLLTDDGTGYSRYNGMAVTRWRDEAVSNKYGIFLYMQDVETNKVWSAAYNPNTVMPDKYKVVFSQDKVSFIRTDEYIDSQTDIVVSPEDDIEVRRLLLTNHDQQPRTIEVTSYMEVVLADQAADVAHPTFSNLFIKTEYISRYNALIAVRRPREQHKAPKYSFHSINFEGEIIGGIQYETDRSKFIGRGRNLQNPLALEPNHPLSNTVGPVLDPVMSIRIRVRLQPGQTAKLSFINGVAKDNDNAHQLIEKYHEAASVERAFELAWTRSQVELGYLGLKAAEIEQYRHMLSHILFISPLKRKQEDIIRRNRRGQESLWSHGISGDLPIVLALIDNNEQLELARELLKAHEYWRLKGFHVDLVLMNTDAGSYSQPLFNILQDIVSVSHARDIRERPGGVFIKQGSLMREEDKNLLITAARLVLYGAKSSIAAQMKAKDVKYQSCSRLWKEDKTEYSVPEFEPLQLTYFNGYGGFHENGAEYVITLNDGLNTPVPWINVISNKGFGFQVSESGAGYSWAENSRENKLSPWANDPTSDPPGEVVYLRDEDSGAIWTVTPQPIRDKHPYRIRHGFGYSLFEHNSNGFRQSMLQYTAIDDPVKLVRVKLKNTADKRRTISAIYYLRPVLGVSDQSTSHYIITEVSDNNIMTARNVFSSDFPDRILFINTSENVRYHTGDRREFIGRFGTLSQPEALCKERLSGMTGAGLDPCMGIQSIIEFEPGQE